LLYFGVSPGNLLHKYGNFKKNKNKIKAQNLATLALVFFTKILYISGTRFVSVAKSGEIPPKKKILC
jgi:hypothetical protein